jgi:signal peptidase I
MIKVTLRLTKLVGWFLFGAVISIFLFIMTASVFGWHFDVVPTKSMEPVYNAGGMVVTRPAQSQEIKIGDPILFIQPVVAEKAFICHRVIGIQQIDGQLFFQTKGDANQYPDPDLVPAQNLIGRVAFYIPQVGNIAYLSRLYKTAISFMGQKISIASLSIFAIILVIVGMEVNNIYKWIFHPGLKRREEILKKRKQNLIKRRNAFGIG